MKKVEYHVKNDKKTMKALLNELQELGLTQNEATVYLALFDVGEAKAGEIIKSTGFHRNIVYTALEELVKWKLVSKRTRKGVTVFVTNDPKPLLTEVQKKEMVARDVIEQLRKKGTTSKQEVIVYEGHDEIRRFEVEHVLRMPKGSEVSILGVISDSWFNTVGEETYQEFVKACEKRKVFQRWLGYEPTQREARQAQDHPDIFEYRYIVGPSLSRSNFQIGPDSVALRNYGSTPLVVEIRNKEMVEDYQKYFDLLWKQSRDVDVH